MTINFLQLTGSIPLRQNPKQELLPPKNTARLDTPRAVRREMAKVYRGVVNGRIAPEDGTRLVFILKEINVAIAAEPQTEPQGAYVHTVNIVGIPSGTFLSEEETEESLSQFNPPPLPSVTYALPMLKVIDGDDELPPAP